MATLVSGEQLRKNRASVNNNLCGRLFRRL